MCEQCELLVREPCCGLQLDQGRLSYGWRLVGLPDSGWFIGRAKKEGRNSYLEVWYKVYGKASVCQTGLQAVQEVLQLYPALDLIHHRPIRQGVRVSELWPTLHRVILLGAV